MLGIDLAGRNEAFEDLLPVADDEPGSARWLWTADTEPERWDWPAAGGAATALGIALPSGDAQPPAPTGPDDGFRFGPRKM